MMAKFSVRFLILWAAMAMCSGAARADLYGFVDGDRVSVIFSDTQPADARYTLYSKERPGQFTEPLDELPGGEGLAPSQFNGHILAAAKETKVDAALIRAVISAESGYNPSARSSAGAVGLMQLIIHGGARYLRDLKVMFGNNLQLVLAAYNAGEGAVKYGRRIPPYPQTAAYVPKVLSAYRKYRAAAPTASG